MIIDLLRHGMPIGGKIFRGNTFDDQLSLEGWKQMELSTNGMSWDFIATSPMKRCKEFAFSLSISSNTAIEVFEDFREIGLGDWEGKSRREIGIHQINSFKANPIANKINNSENVYGFHKRVTNSLKKIIDSYSNYDCILVVAHAGVIRSIKSYMNNLPIEDMFNLEVAPGSLERLYYTKK